MQIDNRIIKLNQQATIRTNDKLQIYNDFITSLRFLSDELLLDFYVDQDGYVDSDALETAINQYITNICKNVEDYTKTKLGLLDLDVDEQTAIKNLLTDPTLLPTSAICDSFNQVVIKDRNTGKKITKDKSEVIPSDTILYQLTDNNWVDLASQNINLYESYYDYMIAYIVSSNIEEAVNQIESDIEEEIPQINMKGHIYPCNLVIGWINKLNNYNNQLEEYMKLLQKLEVQIEQEIKGSLSVYAIQVRKTNKAWIAKMCEKFCRKINYLLDLLRYGIIKVLHGLYESVFGVLGIFEPLLELPSANPMAIVNFLKGIVDMILKPYKLIITFIKDFFKYTPKLVSAASKLMINVVKVPSDTISVLNKLEQAVIKEIEEAKKQGIKIIDYYEDIDKAKSKTNIRFQSITIADIVSGNVQKPRWKDY